MAAYIAKIKNEDFFFFRRRKVCFDLFLFRNKIRIKRMETPITPPTIDQASIPRGRSALATEQALDAACKKLLSTLT